jgi:uncharacterized protein (DUF1697 family)
MATYIALLRGINVSGSNKISMSDLRESLNDHGVTHVKTYVQKRQPGIRTLPCIH